MHVAFRTMAQQTGLQLYRAILPESIDVVINAAIQQKTLDDIRTGVGNELVDSAAYQTSSMSIINSLKHLYKSAKFSLFEQNIETGEYETISERTTYNQTNGFHIFNIPTKQNAKSSGSIINDECFIDSMMILGVSLLYTLDTDGNETYCRIVGADVIENTLKDFCNTATKQTPIAVFDSIIGKDDNSLEIYTNTQRVKLYTNTPNLKIHKVELKYIKNPNKVKWNADINKCVNCDLAEFTHFDIIQRAVRLYYNSVSSSIQQNNKN